MADPLIGRSIAGQFELVERIGSGGMGSVYKAHQASMNRDVAVKVLHQKYASRADLAARFRREARAMSQLSHPNTARVFLHDQDEHGTCYLVMEFLQGQNLATYVRRQGAMEPARALNIMVQVCGALEEAHDAGIVHRDLKPENIFLTTQGGIADFPKVLDFGLAKVTEKQMRPGSVFLTRQGMVFGTPEFMSPEQAQGEPLDRRSDIYSLGLILYELLTTKLPFDVTKPIDVMKAQIKTPPIPLAERRPDIAFPPGLQDVMDKTLAKSRDDRFASAAEFAGALRACLAGKQRTMAPLVVPGSPAPASPPANPGPGPTHAKAHNPADPPSVPMSKAPFIVLGIVIGLVVAVVGALIATQW